MGRSTLIAILLSWATYAVVGVLAWRKDSSTPNVNADLLVLATVLGAIGMVLIHAWAITRDERRSDR